MKKQYPQFNSSINPNVANYITFIGKLQPHINLPEYTVRLVYRSWKTPRVSILSPALVEKPIHFFKNTRTLCLFHKKNFTWKKEYSITMLVPWVSSWIYFYEVWKETGIWYGEEAEHDSTDNNKIQID